MAIKEDERHMLSDAEALNKIEALFTERLGTPFDEDYGDYLRCDYRLGAISVYATAVIKSRPSR